MEYAVLSHSHLVIQHLLQQLQSFVAEKKARPRRPEWMDTLIQDVAAQFHPLGTVARVGYECEPTETGWQLRMYLGSSEVVGGKDDGRSQVANFDLGILKLIKCFDDVTDITWSSIASTPDTGRSFITLDGIKGQQSVCLKVYAFPPRDSGLALRTHLDGSVEEVPRQS